MAGVESGDGVTTLRELQLWMEGEFKLLRQVQDTAGKDLTKVRERVHELANEVGKISALKLEERFAKLEAADLEADKNLTKLLEDAKVRQGVIMALKVMYLIIGGAVGTGITLLTIFLK